MYTTDYPNPEQTHGYVANKIVTKEEIEGRPAPEIERYGTLCKSLVQESFQAPPASAYNPKKSKERPRDPPGVGTVPPDRDVSFIMMAV